MTWFVYYEHTLLLDQICDEIVVDKILKKNYHIFIRGQDILTKLIVMAIDNVKCVDARGKSIPAI